MKPVLQIFVLCCAICLSGVYLLLERQGGWKLIKTDDINLHPTAITAVEFIDSSRGWALIGHGLYRTNDGGNTWSHQSNPPDGEMYNGLTFVSSTIGWVVGLRGTGEFRPPYEALIRSTTDGGESWQLQSVGLPAQPSMSLAPSLYSVSFCNPDVGWAVGETAIVHSRDGGRKWETQRESTNDGRLISVICVSPEQAWAVGLNGLILHTADGGRTWLRQESGAKEDLLRVRFFNGGVWVVGGKGTLLRTPDGGKSWERQRLNPSVTLHNIHLEGQRGWIVGAEGTILHTKDGGQTWRRYQSPTDNDLISLFFISSKQGWAGGNRRTLLRFSD